MYKRNAKNLKYKLFVHSYALYSSSTHTSFEMKCFSGCGHRTMGLYLVKYVCGIKGGRIGGRGTIAPPTFSDL